MMNEQILPRKLNHLVGKTVKQVTYVDSNDAKELGWYSVPPVIEFTDGTLLVLQSDDEGNNGGAGLVMLPDGKTEYLLYTLRT